MKSSELLLVSAMLADASVALHASTDKDVETLHLRVKHEGLSFLTITLPSFCSDFERSLELGYVETNAFLGFSKLRSAPRIPRFLSGILLNVFNTDGVIRSSPSVDAIFFVRQICLMFKKTKTECTDERKAKAILSYKSCESDLRSFRPTGWLHASDFIRVCNLVYGPMFLSIEEKLRNFEHVPKHGPGAVYERFTSNGKYRSRVWHRRLDLSFPPDQFLVGNPTWFLDPKEYARISYVDKIDTTRVVFVPKTMKNPRVIAIEPIYNQYAQQSLLRLLVSAIECNPLTRDRVNFSSSENNGRLARSSSIDRSYATLDLSEASDRVHAGIVHMMIRHYPLLTKAVFSCRTKYAELPNGEKIAIRKFASMGSALCFPMESIVFHTMCLLGYLKSRNLPLTVHHIEHACSKITVFGDDLIVPTGDASTIMSIIESAQLKINRKKTFLNGYFRESCGVDVYKGYNVTPIYCRRMMPKSRREVDKIVSLVAFGNLLYEKGCWITTRAVRTHVESLIGSLPYSQDGSYLAWHSMKHYTTFDKWDNSLFRPLVHAFKLCIRKRKDKLHGYDRLLKFFLTRSAMPSEIEEFDTSAIRSSLSLRKKWMPAF